MRQIVMVGLVMAIGSIASAQVLMIEDFEGPQAISRLTASPGVKMAPTTQAVTHGKQALEYRIASVERGGAKDEDRRIRINLPKPLDLSRYSRLCFDVTPKVAGYATIACTLYEPQPTPDKGWEAQVLAAPGFQKTTLVVDLNGLAREVDPVIDVSQVATIGVNAGLRQHEDVAFIIDNVRAEYDPAAGSPAEKLAGRARELKKQYAAIMAKVAWNKLDPKKGAELKEPADAIVNDLDGVLAACEAGRRSGFNGTFNALVARFKRIREGNEIGRLLLADKGPLYLWSISPYVNSVPDERPRIDSDPLKEIRVSMARGEFRDAVFMISAAAEGEGRNVTVSLETDDEPLRKTTLVQEALYVKNNLGETVGDAHYPIKGSVRIPGGQSRQIRLRFDATDAGLAAGTHAFRIAVNDDKGGATQVIPGSIEVWNFHLPGHEIMSNNTYCEFGGSSLEGLEDLMVKDMKAYGLNVFYVPPEAMTPVQPDGQRRFDFAALDRYVAMVMQSWGDGPPPQFIFSLAGAVAPSPDQLPKWVEQFTEALKRHGIEPKQWYFVFLDEVPEARLSTLELPLGEQMRRATPSAQITTNSSAILNDLAEMIRYFKTVDRREPDWDEAARNPYLLDYLRLSPRPIAFYRCRGVWSARGANLYDYYRVYAWHAIREGATGLGLWTYCADRGADPWKGPANQYSLVLKHPTLPRTLVHTRRYETYREGIDDYRYVAALREAARRKGPEALESAEELIRQAIDQITSDASDTTRCETWRMRLAEEILRLQ